MKAFILFVFLLLFINIGTVRIQPQTVTTKHISINPNIVQVKKGCVIIFSECDFNGEKIEICKNQHDLRLMEFDKKVASILIGHGTSVILKKGYNFKGVGVELKNSVRCFDKMFSQFRRNISSLAISQLK